MSFLQRKNSKTTIVALIVLTLVAIVAITRRDGQRAIPRDVVIPQASRQAETHALYIAQTALDRSIKELVANPGWRDGFTDVPFDSGTYNVRVFDAGTGPLENGDAAIPPNYVRIVASSQIEGVTKEVEAVWVNAMSAFQYGYCAGNSLEIEPHRASSALVLADVNNNSWQEGGLKVGAGVTVYGDVSSAGDVSIGGGTAGTIVYGSVTGARIDIAAGAEIRRFENLSERAEGIDLNGDGDAMDIGVSRAPLRITAAEALVSGGRELQSGQSDRRIAGSSVPVTVGLHGLGPVVDPRPDFITYYELVTGHSSYPPSLDHVSTPIRGDGEGRYFASAKKFIEWLEFQHESAAVCWRCAGDGRIDPANESDCPSCSGTGQDAVIEVTGVFYVDDSTLDLSDIGTNLIVHGTVVVADGNPYGWPEKDVETPGGSATIDHCPSRGEFVLAGQNRKHLTITYRSDEDGGSYVWRTRTIGLGSDAQTVPVREPAPGHAMRDMPAVLAAERVEIGSRGTGFAYHPGDIGDESMTVVQGVVYADQEVTLHGEGGWAGETIVFDEEQGRSEGDMIDESVFGIDLNGDGDISDTVELSAIATVPVIRVSRGEYNVDINKDGVFSKVTIGIDYLRFFDDNGHRYPTLVYHEGILLGQSLHSCAQVLVIHDAGIARSGVPFGFEVSFGSTTWQGLVSWWERRTR
jgi:cytoskeletal protein CcmA (bactofilin family)